MLASSASRSSPRSSEPWFVLGRQQPEVAHGRADRQALRSRRLEPGPASAPARVAAPPAWRGAPPASLGVSPAVRLALSCVRLASSCAPTCAPFGKRGLLCACPPSSSLSHSASSPFNPPGWGPILTEIRKRSKTPAFAEATAGQVECADADRARPATGPAGQITERRARVARPRGSGARRRLARGLRRAGIRTVPSAAAGGRERRGACRAGARADRRCICRRRPPSRRRRGSESVRAGGSSHV